MKPSSVFIPALLLFIFIYNISFSQTTTEEIDDIDYFEFSLIIICDSLNKNGEFVGVSNNFKLGPDNKVNVTIHLDNASDPFLTKAINVEVYKGASELVEDFVLNIQPERNYLSFVYTFTQQGEYNIDLYTANEVYINTASVTIQK